MKGSWGERVLGARVLGLWGILRRGGILKSAPSAEAAKKRGYMIRGPQQREVCLDMDLQVMHRVQEEAHHHQAAGTSGVASHRGKIKK